jgi:TonB-linked SusC/RagA family outer membrane protein
MKNISRTALRAGFALALLLVGRPPCFAQVLALSPAQEGTRTAGAVTVRQLNDVLKEFKNHYRVDILFADQMVAGYTVPSDAVDTRNKLEKNLEAILTPFELEFKKARDGSYLITRRKPRTPAVVPQPASTPPADKPAGDTNPGKETAALVEEIIRGTVTDASNGEGLAGVAVLLKGTSQGTTTDASGRYQLSVPNESAVLVFSYVGFLTEEVTVGNRTTIDIRLAGDIKTLGEVVVVGYGTQSRKDLTGSISSVRGEDIGKLPVASVTQALQGQAAGVEIVTNNGAPGANVSVRIRGVGTVNNTDPLYVVDGLPIFGGLNQINPQDIESIEVLKDASAGAIYGARAANGVVLITTKKGQEGPLRVSLNAYYGSQSPWKKLDLMNAQEYRGYIGQLHANSGTTPPPAITDPAREGVNTDWQDLMLSPAPIQSYNLSLSGGGKNATFSISGGLFSQAGILKNTRYDRANIQINSQGTKGRFKFGESFLVAGDMNKPEPNFQGSTMFNFMMSASPLVVPTNAQNLGGFGGAVLAEDNFQFLNPYGYSSLFDGRNRGLNVLGSLYGQFEILKGLDYRLNLGTDLASGRGYAFVPTFNMNVNSNNAATLSNSNNNRLSWLAENTLTYRKALGRHDVTGLLGYSNQYLLNDNFSATADNFPSNDVRVLAAASRANKNNDGRRDELYLRSYFARVNYSFANKYLLTATIRRDGSSNFSRDNRYGNFPSVSVGWVLSEESFMKGIPAVSFLKLRGSYGLLGNQNIGAYNYEAVLNQSSNYVLGTGQTIATGIIPRRLPSDARWETTIQTDVGVELGLFGDRLMLVADYFDRQTEDMLIAATNIPFTTGLPELPFINAGGINNRGVELAMTYKKATGPFTYSVTGNFTTYRNEVTSLGEGGKPIFSVSSYTKTEVGSSIGRFFGYVADGIFQNQAEIDAAAEQNGAGTRSRTQPGDIRFRDLDDNGVINDLDRTYIGSPLPRFTYGLNVNSGYRGFDLSFLFYGVQGNNIINTLIPGLNSNVNTTTAAFDAWTPENPNTNVPRAIIGDPNGNLRQSSRYIESGSFLRLRNVTLGYNIPSAVVGKMKVSGLRVYVSGQNLLTFTKYTGFDPETANGSAPTQFAFGGPNNSANLLRGLDRGTYPLARTILGGVQIDF